MAGGQLIHSKLTVEGHGKCQTDEACQPRLARPSMRARALSFASPRAVQELDNIIAKLRGLTG